MLDGLHIRIDKAQAKLEVARKSRPFFVIIELLNKNSACVQLVTIVLENEKKNFFCLGES